MAKPNSSIAERLGLTKATVGKWRTRFIERRVAGFYDNMRPGPPRTIDDERVASLIKTTLHTKPANGSTHWSVRSVAAETGISKSSVQRYFQLFGLQPRRSENFKVLNDPFFVEKLRGVLPSACLSSIISKWEHSAQRDRQMPARPATAIISLGRAR